MKRLFDYHLIQYILKELLVLVYQKIIYKSVTYGANIRKRKSSITFKGNKVPSYQIGIQSMKRNLFVITIEKADALIVFPDLITTRNIV